MCYIYIYVVYTQVLFGCKPSNRPHVLFKSPRMVPAILLVMSLPWLFVHCEMLVVSFHFVQGTKGFPYVPIWVTYKHQLGITRCSIPAKKPSLEHISQVSLAEYSTFSRITLQARYQCANWWHPYRQLSMLLICSSPWPLKLLLDD